MAEETGDVNAVDTTGFSPWRRSYLVLSISQFLKRFLAYSSFSYILFMSLTLLSQLKLRA
jgi:hypothetical protein